MLKFSKVSDFFTSEQIVNFGIRIRQIRLAKKIKIIHVCNSAGINPAVLSRLEHGKAIPGTEILVKLCLFYSASPDWILFGTGEQEIQCSMIDWSAVGRRIKDLRGSISQNQFSSIVGIGSSLGTKTIENSEAIPYLYTLIKISKALKVSLTYILFGVGEKPRIKIHRKIRKTPKIYDFLMPQQLNDIGARIRKLRLSRQLTLAKTGRLISINEIILNQVELGHMAPSVNALTKLCNFFKSSPDWILFGGEEKTVQFELVDWAKVGERIKKMRQIKGTGTLKLSNLKLIEQGKTKPTLKTILRMSEVFEVSLSFILFGVNG
jgi:transcriptional regulator with XRE-family HTH domain